ncbi:hypothetical protein PV08_11922 [Exophiala spinifera]|uniref:NAD(P)-binding domain-containing protein n=1 Tax=Exophiala spinifera TaxID=91928 RepID=A0A0D1Y4D9_9EURO|nr:uncharacterized protein PV08_11922 [Exophiala spinifera]KIW09821.1 hypothetical protein PV08_11922 [Exophiala spinifera]
MDRDKVLVFGATGPAGICVLRELLSRNIPALAFCRNPGKIPKDLSDHALLEILKGDMTNREDFSRAISKSRAIISLLGPSADRQPRNTFADYYRTIVSSMKEHGVHRFLVLGTTAIYRHDDRTSIVRSLMKALIQLVVNHAYQNVMAIQEYFDSVQDPSIEWTVYRLGWLTGTSDPAAWSEDRKKGEAYAGPVGGPGFTSGVNRSILAKWLVDTSLDPSAKWKQQMPAVSNLRK